MSARGRTRVQSSRTSHSRFASFPSLCMPATQAICITTHRFKKENVYDQGLYMYCVTKYLYFG